MIEVIGGFGMVCIIILQGANVYQGRRLSAKIDNMVSDKTCLERQAALNTVADSKRRHQNRELRIIERKLANHCHNGDGVKFLPVDTD